MKKILIILLLFITIFGVTNGVTKEELRQEIGSYILGGKPYGVSIIKYLDNLVLLNKDNKTILEKLKQAFENEGRVIMSDTTVSEETKNIALKVMAYGVFLFSDAVNGIFPGNDNGGNGQIVNNGTGIGVGNAKTKWGFKGFTKPTQIVNVPSGGDLKSAIAGGNKIVKLAPGTYTVTHLDLPSNLILEGSGIGKTIIKSAGGGYVISVRHENKNVIVRNLTINASGNGGANGFEIVYGPDNILVDNIEIFGAGKSNLIVRQEKENSQNITFNRIKSHDASSYHCISFRIVKGGQILNSETWGCSGYGIDISTSDYIEMGYNYVHNTMGTKYPAVDHLYAHNNRIINNKVGDGPGLKIQRECGPAGHLHFEKNVIKDNKVAVRDRTFSCASQTPLHFAELVWQNNEIWGDSAIGKVTRMEVYGKNGDLKTTKPANRDPYLDNIGYKTR